MALFDVALPIIQAPMAGSQQSALAIAVSRAGGLGSLPAALLDPATLSAEMSATTAGTARACNVNFFCHRPAAVDESRERAWRERLAPYYRELGLDEAATSSGPTRRPFDADALRMVESFRPRVVSFHFGLPDEGLLAAVRATGAKIVSSATTVDEARVLAARGVDAIIAQGIEAGGHRGTFLAEDPLAALPTQMGTLSLVRRLVRELRVPVIAAGGIADAHGVRAALALGATAVQIGTSYLLCDEAATSPVHRAALADRDAPTAVTNLISGRPARGIVNRLMRDFALVDPKVPAFPLAAGALAPLRREAERRGLGDFSPLWAGQDTNGCAARPAGDVTRALAGH